MLVHKGGQINNVQLITGVRIAEMSQLQNVKMKKKSQGGSGRGQVRCLQRNKELFEVVVKMKRKKKLGGGGGGQGGCVQRIN